MGGHVSHTIAIYSSWAVHRYLGWVGSDSWLQSYGLVQDGSLSWSWGGLEAVFVLSGASQGMRTHPVTLQPGREVYLT